MTDQDIVALYLRLEKLAMRAPRGADHNAILADVAVMAERNLLDVRRLVLDSILSDPN